MYCESDQASLCWDCDEKVHCANFLVAKHLRCLLCHVCQSLTPWKASGPKLGPTVSVCDACVAAARCGVNDDDKAVVRRGSQSERISGHDETDDDDDYEDEDDDDDDDEDPDEEEEEEDDENQVVPWSGDDSQSPPQPPPPPVSSSCSSISEEDFSLKRMRDFGDLFSDVSLYLVFFFLLIFFFQFCFQCSACFFFLFSSFFCITSCIELWVDLAGCDFFFKKK